MAETSAVGNGLVPGDILAVDRGLYRHYGVYAGDGKVIQYASKDGDFGSGACVHETEMNGFLRGGKCQICAVKGKKGLFGHPAYSRQRTLERAKSRIGEQSYNLVFNNCEHFAMWCKTGVSRSQQVQKTFLTIAGIAIGLVAAKAAKDALEGDTI
jgi:hypothetical protein